MPFSTIFTTATARSWSSFSTFISSNLLSTFVAPAMVRWYSKCWTALKAWRKMMRGNATVWNWFSLLDLLLWPYGFCLLLPYHAAVHAPAGRLRWKIMHLCSSWDHRNRHIGRICALKHVTMHVRRCASMCCRPTWSIFQSKKLNLFRKCMLCLCPFLLLQPPYQVLQNFMTTSNAHAAIAHEPGLFCWLG